MAIKFFVFLFVLAASANAGYPNAPSAVSHYHHAPVAVGTQTQSVYRSADGNHAISMYSKAVDTPYSSVRKYDTRVTNDAVAYAPIAHASHAPAVAHVAHVAQAPAVAHVVHAPVMSYTPSYATSSHYHSPVLTPSYTPTVAKVPTLSSVDYSHEYGHNHHY